MTAVRRTSRWLLAVLLLATVAMAIGYALRLPDGADVRDAAVPGPAPVAQRGAAPTQPAPSPTHPVASVPDPAPTATAPATATVAPPPPAPSTPPPAPPPPRVLEPGRPLLSPGDDGDEVRDLQARLKEIAWFSGDVTGAYGDVTAEAVRGFQAKREIPVTGVVDQRTHDRLDAMTSTPTHAALFNLGNQPGPLDVRCRAGRVLCIDKSSRTLRWVVDGRVLETVDVRFGSEYTPTREGVFSVQYKSRDHVSTLYDSSMPFAMFFSGGQAVHYSSDFAARGYTGASHGCVNVRDYDAVARLFDQVEVGDEVVVYWS